MSVTKELHTWEVTVPKTGTDPSWTELRVQAQTVSWEGGALAFRTDGQLVKVFGIGFWVSCQKIPVDPRRCDVEGCNGVNAVHLLDHMG